jgi:hypothetical protein
MELENARTSAGRELVVFRDHRQRVKELEKDRDALLESMWLGCCLRACTASLARIRTGSTECSDWRSFLLATGTR